MRMRCSRVWMRSSRVRLRSSRVLWMTSSLDVDENSRVVRASDFNAEVATALGSIPASSDRVKSEGQQTKQC
jgi:hypothetical protein